VATGEREVIPCGIVFRSVGYQGVAMEGVPFDEDRCTMRNRGGRVLDERGEPISGVYCTGWIKRGPTGIIGTNKKDATETVEALLEDAREGRLPRRKTSAEATDAWLAERGIDVVTYSGWDAIDALERGRGEELGRPRVKLLTWEELLSTGLQRVP
jgi:ferredoxin/flavodoxin---NADP+ reductase